MVLGINPETKRANRDQKEQPDGASRHHQVGIGGENRREERRGVDDAKVSSKAGEVEGEVDGSN